MFSVLSPTHFYYIVIRELRYSRFYTSMGSRVHKNEEIKTFWTFCRCNGPTLVLELFSKPYILCFWGRNDATFRQSSRKLGHRRKLTREAYVTSSAGARYAIHSKTDVATVSYVTAVASVRRRDAIHEYQSTSPRTPPPPRSPKVAAPARRVPPTYGKSVLVNW